MTDIAKSAYFYMEKEHPVVPGGMKIIDGQKKVWQSRWAKSGNNESFLTPFGFDEFMKKHKGVNSLAIRCDRLTVVDIDVKKLSAKKQLEVLYKIVGDEDHLNLISTCAEQSQSGGLHLYFQLIPELKKMNLRRYNDSLDVDIQTGSGSVVYTAPTLGKYEWMNAGPILPMPRKLAKWLKNLTKEPSKPKAYESRSRRLIVSQTQEDNYKRAYMNKVKKNAVGLVYGSMTTTLLRLCRPWFNALKDYDLVYELAEYVNNISERPMKKTNLDKIVNSDYEYYKREK